MITVIIMMILIIQTIIIMIIIGRPGSPVCKCNKGWGGAQCTQPICNPPCRYPHNDDLIIMLTTNKSAKNCSTMIAVGLGISVVHCWGNLWVPGVLFDPTNISNQPYTSSHMLHIQLLEYPIPLLSSSSSSARHKIRHMAISREPREVSQIRWCQNNRKQIQKTKFRNKL